jgi:glucosamine--fructose-6-phosphate aminotransferase (isomerizing)
MPLRNEILEQSQKISGLIASQTENIKLIAKTTGRPQGILIAARGTSDNAARYAKYVWGLYNRIPVTLAAPSLFSVYHQPPDLKNMLVVGISQSGESPDLIAVLEGAKTQGCQTLAITNQTQSPLAKVADYLIDIQAGPELSVAATKTYTCQLTAIALLSAAWSDNSQQELDLHSLPEKIEEVLEQENQIKDFATRYRYMDQCVVLGRGFNYATAYEWSLKLKELTYVVSQPYSSADFQHGPIALVSSGFPVFAITVEGPVFEDMKAILTTLKQKNKAELFLISNSQALLEHADCPITLPDKVPEWLTPMVGIVPAQLFSYHLSLIKGMDPDAPRGLTKVTKTK